MKRMIVSMCVLAVTAVMWAQEPPKDAPKPAPKAATGPADPQKEGVAVTVYNGNFGVVRELRKMKVEGGDAKFTDVAKLIDPTSVHFKSLTDPAAKLLEQNYQFDLVSADKLLQKYLDQQIEVFVKESDKNFAGKLLSFDAGQLVLQEAAGGLVMVQRPDNVRDIRFKSLPDGLLVKPTLVWKLATEKPGDQLLEVTYQTGGLDWHAEYVMVLQDDDASADLSGWVSVNNQSGKTYKDARLKFIAGDVKKVREQRNDGYGMEKGGRGDGAPAMEEKAFFEYHMYTFGRESTLADSEVKQLEMFNPVRGLKTEKRYIYNPHRTWRWYGGRTIEPNFGLAGDKKVQVRVEFDNAEKNKLGIPLPAGKVRVYKQDASDKAMEFIGEEMIDHTPRGERVKLVIGNAFDITGERKQTSFKVETGRKWMEESFQVKVKNAKDSDVTVRVVEPMYRWNQWKITAESQEHLKVEQADEADAFHVVWDVPVKAKGETILTYTVEYHW